MPTMITSVLPLEQLILDGIQREQQLLFSINRIIINHASTMGPEGKRSDLG